MEIWDSGVFAELFCKILVLHSVEEDYLAHREITVSTVSKHETLPDHYDVYFMWIFMDLKRYQCDLNIGHAEIHQNWNRRANNINTLW